MRDPLRAGRVDGHAAKRAGTRIFAARSLPPHSKQAGWPSPWRRGRGLWAISTAGPVSAEAQRGGHRATWPPLASVRATARPASANWAAPARTTSRAAPAMSSERLRSTTSSSCTPWPICALAWWSASSSRLGHGDVRRPLARRVRSQRRLPPGAHATGARSARPRLKRAGPCLAAADARHEPRQCRCSWRAGKRVRRRDRHELRYRG